MKRKTPPPKKKEGEIERGRENNTIRRERDGENGENGREMVKTGERERG